MVIGIGTDILEISRIESTRRTGTETRIFTEHERRQASGRDSMLAGDFACKEAVAKCLHVDRTIKPDPKTAEEYDRLYCCYKQIHDALAPVYKMRGEMK